MKVTTFSSADEAGFSVMLTRADIADSCMCAPVDLTSKLMYELCKALADDFVHNDLWDEVQFLMEYENMADTIYNELEKMTSSFFWECNCVGDDFIHPKTDAKCNKCGASVADCADAQVLSLFESPERINYETMYGKMINE